MLPVPLGLAVLAACAAGVVASAGRGTYKCLTHGVCSTEEVPEYQIPGTVSFLYLKNN